MRFTVVATGQFRLRRAFGFRLTASSLTQLSVVNSQFDRRDFHPRGTQLHRRTPERRSGNRERSAAVLSRSRLGGRAAGKLLDRSAVLKPLRLRTAALRPSGYFGIRVCAGEAGCRAGASPAGRIGLFTTESRVREEAARPNPKARRGLNCPVATTVNLI